MIVFATNRPSLSAVPSTSILSPGIRTTLDSSSLPVNFPDPQKAELIWEELYAEICDPHPRAYVFDFNTLRKGLIAAEAFSRIVEEDRLLGNEVAGDTDTADTEN